MKNFMSRYSYESVHLFLNQFAIGLFGITLALAAKMAKNDILSIVTSVFSIIFYLFLQYIVMWKVGATDRLSADLGKFKKDYSIPIKMWLLSNSLNLFLALLITLRAILPDVAFIYSVGGVANVIKRIIEGMYMGILAIRVGGQPLHLFWFVHFLTTLPALAVIFAAYALGFNNFKLFKSEGKKSK
jgi:hypothetical protein